MNPLVLPDDSPRLPAVLAELLETGGVLIFPTDTVFGIGGSPWDEGALTRVRSLKGRPADQPFTLHLPSREAISRFARLDPRTASIIEHFLPGPYTFLLEARPDAPPCAVKGGKVGVRVPNHRFFLKVMATLDRALFGTSVNRTGAPPLTDLEEIIEKFSTVDLIVSGRIKTGIPSSVIDLTSDPPRLLRGRGPDELRCGSPQRATGVKRAVKWRSGPSPSTIR